MSESCHYPSNRCPTAPRMAVLLSLALAATGCESPVATSINVTPGDATLTALGATASFSAEILDQNGDPYAGVVAWSSGDEGVFTVSSEGTVTARGNGRARIGASFEDVEAAATVTVRQTPAAVEIFSGDGQEAVVRTRLVDPIVVLVADSEGWPVPNATVAFRPAPGDGEVEPASGETGADGTIQTLWTLGQMPGEQGLAASAGDAGPVEIRATALAGTRYEVAFVANWTDSTHPYDNFPSNPHFSPLVASVHSSEIGFWELGDTASHGMESMAETGSTQLLAQEISPHYPRSVLRLILRSVVQSPGSDTFEVVVHERFPLVTLVTMLGPSPDWFAGVTSLSLMDAGGAWVERLEVPLYPLDAGTDSGTSYNSPNEDTSPPENIHGKRGQSPFSDNPVAFLSFDLVTDG